MRGSTAGLARPRRSYIHCQWVREQFITEEHQGTARLRRWQKVWTGLQEEFTFDPMKEAE